MNLILQKSLITIKSDTLWMKISTPYGTYCDLREKTLVVGTFVSALCFMVYAVNSYTYIDISLFLSCDII